jgi:CheY-like chemotaxis protein
VERDRSILLVDDDDAIREALTETLIDEGYAVHAARNGREALDWLRQGDDPPCVVLLDLMMPVMDGRAFLGERRSDPILAKIPVVVISAERGCAELLTQSHQVNAVLAKPIALQGLLAAINRCAPAH